MKKGAASSASLDAENSRFENSQLGIFKPQKFLLNKIFLYIFIFLIFVLLININFISAQKYSVNVTLEHPFLLANGEWVDAKDLKIGDELKTIDENFVKVTKLTEVVLDESVKVYNLENSYNTFVLSGGVVVHNSELPIRNKLEIEFAQWEAKGKEIIQLPVELQTLSSDLKIKAALEILNRGDLSQEQVSTLSDSERLHYAEVLRKKNVDLKNIPDRGPLTDAQKIAILEVHYTEPNGDASQFLRIWQKLHKANGRLPTDFVRILMDENVLGRRVVVKCGFPEEITFAKNEFSSLDNDVLLKKTIRLRKQTAGFPEDTSIWTPEQNIIQQQYQDAANLFFDKNVGLIFSTAKEFARKIGRKSSMDIEDLTQEGYLAVVKSFDGYDPTTGNKFSTYAVNAMIYGMKKAVLLGGASVTLPGSVVRGFNAVRAEIKVIEGRIKNPFRSEVLYSLKERLSEINEQVKKNNPNADEIKEKDLENAYDFYQGSRRDADSVERLMFGEDFRHTRGIEDQYQATPDTEAFLGEIREITRSDLLTDYQKRVVRLSYEGLFSEEEPHLTESNILDIAKKLNTAYSQKAESHVIPIDKILQLNNLGDLISDSNFNLAKRLRLQDVKFWNSLTPDKKLAHVRKVIGSRLGLKCEELETKFELTYEDKLELILYEIPKGPLDIVDISGIIGGVSPQAIHQILGKAMTMFIFKMRYCQRFNEFAQPGVLTDLQRRIFKLYNGIFDSKTDSYLPDGGEMYKKPHTFEEIGKMFPDEKTNQPISADDVRRTYSAAIGRIRKAYNLDLLPLD